MPRITDAELGQLHALGIRKYGRLWLRANRRAIDELETRAQDSSIPVSAYAALVNAEVLRVMPLIVARVMDGVREDQGWRWDDQAHDGKGDWRKTKRLEEMV